MSQDTYNVCNTVETIVIDDCCVPFDGGSGPGAVSWGEITGTLADQTDLQAALNAKLSNITGFIAQGSNITITGNGTQGNPYTINGAAGVSTVNGQSGPAVSLTQDNVPDGSTAKQFTATEKAKVALLSGTNTGDQIISDATISLSDITTNNVSVSAHGFVPKLPNDSTKYLNGLGAWATVAGGGSGTVTAVTVAAANGVSATVANQGTTPQLTISLGAITPTSVNGTTATEIGYVAGATSSIQTQLNAKQATITGGATTITTTNLTASRALSSDASGKVAVATTTLAELNFLSGTTSAVQTQLNAKAPLASPALTGTPTAPTATVGTNTTQIATTQYVMSAGFTANPSLQFQDETVNLGSANTVDTINYAGAGITATRVGNTVTVTVPGGSGGATWGSITGTLSSQTDLQAALDSKRTYARVNNGDSNVSIASSTRVVGTTAALTAPRTWTLPAANTVPAGEEIVIVDTFGGVTATNTLTIAAAGSDLINGLSTSVLTNAFNIRRFLSNGSNAWTTTAAGVSAINIQNFTASGTWNKMPGAKFVRVYVLGAGGGGGSGRRGAAGTVRCAGGAGAGGVLVVGEVDASLLGSTETVTVGAGGAGGLGQATADTNGLIGQTGGSSSFGGYWVALGGNPGGAGTTSTGAAGGAAYNVVTPHTYGQSAGGAASTTGANGGSSAAATSLTPTGGGAGGGLSSADANGAAGNAGAINPVWLAGSATGAIATGSLAANGIDGNPFSLSPFPGGLAIGTGGSGSRGNNTGSTGNGGNGSFGGGGGGSGAILNGLGTAGNGGRGGDGWVSVVTYF